MRSLRYDSLAFDNGEPWKYAPRAKVYAHQKDGMVRSVPGGHRTPATNTSPSRGRLTLKGAQRY